MLQARVFDGPIMVLGEAMIELSAITANKATIGVAGDTFNTAVSLARLGSDVSYITAVGDCGFSDRIRRAIASEGIDDSLVQMIPESRPGLYAVELDELGERSFVYWRSSSAATKLLNSAFSGVILKAVASCDVLYLSGISLSIFPIPQRNYLIQAMKEAKERGADVIFDGNYRSRGWSSASDARAALTDAYANTTMALPTFEDEHDLFGDEIPEETASRLFALGANEVVVKDGARGALIDGSNWATPSQLLTPIDTTGAGDAFNAAYINARLTGSKKADAAARANALAAAVIMQTGALLPHEHEAYAS
ncbi:MAG: sugar kinase [Henriciella sp.]